MEEDLILQFQQITGVSETDLARQYLNLTEYDLNAAITLFFESGGVTPDQQTEAFNSREEDNRNIMNHSISETNDWEVNENQYRHLFSNRNEVNNTLFNEITHLDDDILVHDHVQDEQPEPEIIEIESDEHEVNNELEDIGVEQNEEEEEEEEEWADGVNGDDEAMNDINEDIEYYDNDIVQDIEEENEESIDYDTLGNGVGYRNRLQPGISRYHHLLREGNRPLDAFHSDSTYKEFRRASRKVNVDIDFEDARQIGKRKKLFILVSITNYQSTKGLKTMAEIYNDPYLQELFKTKFISTQYNMESDRGRQYLNFYPVRSYPHLAVIDPRTGERLKVFSNDINKYALFRDLRHFLNKNSLTGKLEYPDLEPEPEKDISKMDEDEQLEAAIKASLEVTKSTTHNRINLDVMEFEDDEELPIDVEVNQNPVDHSIDDQDKEKTPILPRWVVDSLLPLDLPDPEPNVPFTRLQFRLPDNSRYVKKLAKTTLVKQLFQFVKTLIPENAKELELFVLRENLMEKLEMNLEEANILNCAVDVTYLD